MADSVPLTLRRHVPPGASRAVAGAVRRADDALRHGNVDLAIREVDRAWRCLPEDSPTLAPIYARLLAWDGRNYVAALRMAERAVKFGPSPDLEALVVRSLLALGREDEATHQLEAALARFCLFPGDALSQVAADALQDSSHSVAGWVGMTSTLDFVWQLSSEKDPGSLEIEAAGQRLPATPVAVRAAGGRRIFQWRPPEETRDEPFHFRLSGVPLLGSGCCARPDFALDGRSESAGRSITGWARIGWAPANPLRLRIVDQDGRQASVTTRTASPGREHWPFTLDLRKSGIQGSRFAISAQLPDGRWQALPDTPLLLESAVRLPTAARHSARKWPVRSGTRRRSRASARRSAMTDVIIPVYRAREETLACLQSVLATIGSHARAVVVDDATDDPALASALDDLAGARQITLLRNTSNLGFVSSVNQALACHPARDAVLLNSDTVVFGDWLERLRTAAYSNPAVGTVTPFTNNGTIASYPGDGSDQVRVDDAAALHAMAGSVNTGATVEIPVGVGCCLYVRRDCLRDVGTFDEAVFDKGYGEESDFCLRARARGWSHRLAADVFVFHAGGRSFGARRAALFDRSQRLLNLRHPGYAAFISRFIEADPVGPLRRRLDERRVAAFDGRFVLIVTLALTGGVDRFVTERCRDLRGQGLFPLVLRPTTAGSPGRFELWTDALRVPDLRYDAPADLRALREWLRSLSIERVEIQHFLGLDAQAVETALSLDRPYDVYLHDYAWICPRVTLIDGSGRYCGEPDVAQCEVCIRKNGSRLDHTISVAALRGRSARWLTGARAVFAPSADAAVRYQRYFPELPIRIAPHGPALAADVPQPTRAVDGIVRVALIGAIGEHKGYRVLLECARDAKRRRLPLHFVVIGYTENDPPLLETGRVFVTGRYTEGEAAHLIRRERAQLAFMPSVWPETWCYALDHAVRAGLPVVAFDLGAIAERLRAAGLGILLPLDCKPRDINDCFLQMAAGETSSGPTEVLNAMINPQVPHETPGDKGLSASVQVLPLPAGLYLFSVSAAAPSPVVSAGNLTLPAMHVSLGPGVRAEDVEFVTGPATHGPWLFAQGDLLVVRVTGAGATLILTSIRAPGGEILSIKVERLESRAEGGMVPATAQKSPRPAGASPDPGIVAPVAAVSLPLQINAHIRARGDRTFTNVPWAGRVEPGLWIESFSVKPLEALGARDLEYKGLTATGFETPWISDDLMCGSRGMGVALIGFAVRLKPSARTAAYDCEYSGYFQSGTVSAPFRNGAPCRSTVANDPLEGLQIRIVKRSSASVAKGASDTVAGAPARAVAPGPKFGKYRDAAADATPPLEPAKPGSARKSAHPSKRGAAATPGVKRPPGKLARGRR